MSKTTIPSKTEILAFLRECGFDPRNQNEMRALTMISKPEYCELRAIELISEAQIAVQGEPHNQHYDETLIRAIRMLVLARMSRRPIKPAPRPPNQGEARAPGQSQSFARSYGKPETQS